MNGRRVEILRQGTDRYGQTLAAIRVEGHDVGDILVSEGLASLAQDGVNLGADLRTIMAQAGTALHGNGRVRVRAGWP